MENLANEKRKQALIEEITKAFDGVGLEDGRTFHEAEARDWSCLPEKWAAARAKDTETRWQDVPDETFRTNPNAVFFLDAKSFRYYIPALMIWRLRYGDSENAHFDSHTFYSILFILSGGTGIEERYHFWHNWPKASQAISPFYIEMFSALNLDQVQVIANTLVFEVERESREREEWIAAFNE